MRPWVNTTRPVTVAKMVSSPPMSGARSRTEPRAALAHDDGAGRHDLAAKALASQPLRLLSRDRSCLYLHLFYEPFIPSPASCLFLLILGFGSWLRLGVWSQPWLALAVRLGGLCLPWSSLRPWSLRFGLGLSLGFGFVFGLRRGCLLLRLLPTALSSGSKPSRAGCDGPWCAGSRSWACT